MTASKLSSTHHFNVVQLRIDLWNRLRTQLHIHQKEEMMDLDTENNKSVSDLLDDLAIIEQYYSFPGKKRVRKLQEFVKYGDFIQHPSG
jgi:arginine decarboxylase